MDKRFISAYKHGFNDGKRAGEHLVTVDVNFIGGSIAMILAERGWNTEDIAGFIEELQARWEAECETTLEDFMRKVEEVSGIELKTK